MTSAVSTGQAILYVFILSLAGLLFIGVLYIARKIDGKDKRDEEDKLVSINDLKYAKSGLYMFSILVLYFMIGIIYDICITYLGLEGLNNIFHWLYIVSTTLLVPLFIAGIWIMIANKIVDNKNQKALARGIEAER